jgi:hypothetical protein
MITEAVVVAIIAGLFGFGGSLIGNHSQRGKVKADAYKSASEGFAASSKALLERIEAIEAENVELREKVQIQADIIEEQAKTIERQSMHIRELESKINKAGLAMR